MTLDQIIGQVVPVSILERALSTQTLGHAYLFSGASGLGKETTARAVAQELKKQGGPLSELHIISGTESIGVEEMRNLREKASYRPAGNSIWIIINAERMTIPASNAFLKILEEPPKGTYFFLTTTQKESILPTIISRCQHLPFRAIPEEDICQWLAEKTGRTLEDALIRTTAKLAQGSLGDAWEYWEGSLLKERERILAKLIQIPTLSYPEILGMSQSWPEERTQMVFELQVFLEWFRDLATVKKKIKLPLYNPSYEQELQRISAYYSEYVLFSIMEQILEMRKNLESNIRIRFHLGYLLLMMKKGALT